jgi:hypothetical protein
VLRLEVTRGAADPAHSASGQVGDAHPGPTDRPQGECQAAGASRSAARSRLPTGRTPTPTSRLSRGRPGLNAPGRGPQ